MTDLTETQRTILAAATVRPGMRVVPLPDRIKGGAAKKVLDALLARGLVAETPACDGEPTVRDGVTLIATAAAFHALGITGPTDGVDHPEDDESKAAPLLPAEPSPVAEHQDAPAAAARPTLRDGTKQSKMIAMLRSPEGATIDEIVAVTGWQPHTVRGAIAGALKKRLGMEVTSAKADGRGRVYRIAE